MIRTMEEFKKWEGPWRRLMRQADQPLFYLEPDYLAVWWKHFGKQYRLWILRFEEKGSVVGFCPLMVRQRSLVDRVFFLGHPTAGHLDLLLEPKWRDGVVAALSDYIREAPFPALFMLKGFIGDTANYERLCGNLRESGHPFAIGTTRNCFIDLREEPKDFSAYYAGRFSPSRRSAMERKEQRLDSLAPLSFGPGSPEDLPAVFEMHRRRWMRKYGHQDFSEKNARSFYTELLELGSCDFSASLFLLRLGSRILSFVYYFGYQDQILLKRLAHDDMFGRFSPGEIGLKQALSAWFDGSAAILSFGVGEDAYKEQWTDRWQPVHTLVTASGHRTARFCLLVRRVKLQAAAFLKRDPKRWIGVRRIAAKSKSILHKAIAFDPSAAARQGLRQAKQALRRASMERETVVYEKRIRPPVDAGEAAFRIRYAGIQELERLIPGSGLPGSEIIDRFEKGYRCIVAESESAILCLAWIQPREIRLPHIVGVKTLRNDTVFWREMSCAKGWHAEKDMLRSRMEDFLASEGFHRICFMGKPDRKGGRNGDGSYRVRFRMRKTGGTRH